MVPKRCCTPAEKKKTFPLFSSDVSSSTIRPAILSLRFSIWVDDIQ